MDLVSIWHAIAGLRLKNSTFPFHVKGREARMERVSAALGLRDEDRGSQAKPHHMAQVTATALNQLNPNVSTFLEAQEQHFKSNAFAWHTPTAERKQSL